MVDPLITSSSSSLPNQSWLSHLRSKIPFVPARVKQTDLVSEIQSTRNPQSDDNQNRVKQTNEQAKIFIKNTTLYTKVNLFHSYCNAGDNTKDADKSYRLAVKDLSRENNPGFFKIRRVMKKYFPHLSLFRMLLFNVLFIGWLPQQYIKKSVDKTLSFSRFELHQGDYLPDLGSKLITRGNNFLANYNRTIERFRDDPDNTLGDRDSYVQRELRKPSILGYRSIEALYKRFANAASRDDIRVRFAPLSNRIKKLQLLDYAFLKKYANIVRVILMPFTISLGMIPFIIAKILEFIPDLIAKKVHSSLIASFIPSVLDNTLEAVARPGFTHAINSFLCDVIEDLLAEMKKAPKDRVLKDIPNVVNETLSEDIKGFAEHLFSLLSREPYKSQDELKHITKYGLEPSSFLERVFKFFTRKHYVDRAWTKDIFVNEVLHPSIILGFNFLFAQPERLEEYLCNLMIMLNKIYDHVPDSNTEEGRALLEEQIEKQIRRKKLVDKAIETGINLATDNIFNLGSFIERLLYFTTNNLINIGSFGLTKSEQVDLIDSYKKIKERSLRLLPDIASDAKDILNSSGYLDPTSSQARQAKEDIETALKDIERLFVSVSNVMPDDNSPVKRVMEKKIKAFLTKEKTLKESIIQINDLHEKLNGLKQIEAELVKFNKTLAKLPSNTEKQMRIIKKHVEQLEKINYRNQFDSLIKTYKELAEQIIKIKRHKQIAKDIQKIITPSWFNRSDLLLLANAQKAFLQNPKSAKYEHVLTTRRNKMENFLKQFEQQKEKKDHQELRAAVRKILNCQHAKLADETHKHARAVFNSKLAKHRSLHVEEIKVLPRHYAKCQALMAKHKDEFPKYFKETHSDLIRSAEILASTAEEMPKDISHYGNNNFIPWHYVPLRWIATAGTFAAWHQGYVGPLKALAATSSFHSIKILQGLVSSVSEPLAKKYADSGYSVATNKAFYEGAIHTAMEGFIHYSAESKK